MKITFIFTDTPDLKALRADYRYQSPLEVRDAASQMPDRRDQIVSISRLVAQLSHALLHVSCKDLGLKEYPIKLVRSEYSKPIWETWYDLTIRFSRPARKRPFDKEGDHQHLHRTLANFTLLFVI